MTAIESDRITVVEVARIYGTAKGNVRAMTERGEIPFQRVEHFVRGDGTTGERYVYLRSVIEAALRRTGELSAEGRAS